MELLDKLELSPEQVTDLTELVKLRQWSTLLLVFRRLDRLATEQLIGFSDQFNAYERRGFVKGVRLGLDTVQGIYSQTHSGKETSDGNPDQITERSTTSTATLFGGIRDAAESEPEPLGWSH